MDTDWQWAASGKHPVAKDFFKLGHFSPLVKEFSKWVDEGYSLLQTSKNRALFAWRFWTRGPQKDRLGCGVVRDCQDQLSRPYPLLMMGTGPLPGWEEQWDLSPLACERTWTEMEYLYAQNLLSLEQLEDNLQRIRPPVGRWPELREASRNSLEDPSFPMASPLSLELREIEKRLADSAFQREIYISLDDQGLFPDPAVAIHYWHHFFKKEGKDIPRAIFMGGTLEKPAMAVFHRPLQPKDFRQLWSLVSIEGK